MIEKECWSCPARTPYDRGWCFNCLAAIPEWAVDLMVVAAPERVAGAVRLAIADWLRASRKPKAPKALNLEDLGL